MIVLRKDFVFHPRRRSTGYPNECTDCLLLSAISRSRPQEICHLHRCISRVTNLFLYQTMYRFLGQHFIMMKILSNATFSSRVSVTRTCAHLFAYIRTGMHRLARRLLRKSVGLVLGGGGAKGFAHLGTVMWEDSSVTPRLPNGCLSVNSGLATVVRTGSFAVAQACVSYRLRM